MCDPITIGALISGGLGLAGSLLGPKPASPPPLPASTADAARTPGATVRVGNGQDDDTTTNSGVALVGAMPEKRVFGRPVGGLGRSGLSL